GPAQTSIGAPLMEPANSYSERPSGRYSNPAMNSAGSSPNHRDRTAFAAVPIFPGDDGAVPAAMIELHRDFVPAVHLDPVDRGVDPAAVRIAHDHDRAGADERTAIVAVPNRCGKARDVDLGAALRVLLERGTIHDNLSERLQAFALFHPGLECVKRSQRRVEA